MIKDKEKGWLVNYVIVFPLGLALVDIITTYVGVCVLGGIELNSLIYGLIYEVGYVPVSLGYLGIVGLSTGFLYEKIISSDNRYATMFLMCLFTIYFIQSFTAVMANCFTLLHQLFNIPPLISNPQPSPQVVESFDRGAFCRMFPGVV